MKALYVTAEMQKYQEIARKRWAIKKDYVDPVFVGWNLRPGSVIAYTGNKNGQDVAIEIEITEDKNDGILGIIANGTAGHTTKAKIATIIMSRDVTVYYSR